MNKIIIILLQNAGAHPYCGIIAIAFALVQPIMAAFRPHPGAPRYVHYFSLDLNVESTMSIRTKNHLPVRETVSPDMAN